MSNVVRSRVSRVWLGYNITPMQIHNSINFTVIIVIPMFLSINVIKIFLPIVHFLVYFTIPTHFIYYRDIYS
jgi:hypothetical protein